MLNFDFFSPTRFIFGPGRECEAGSQIKQIGGQRVLLHFGGQSARASGLLDRVSQSLTDAGLETILLGGVQPNPRDSLVYEGIALCRREKIDTVLAIGGGSVLDSAKAIAIGSCYAGDFWDIYSAKAKPTGRLLLGTIITLPATGSEGSNSSVIRRDSENLKRGLRSDLNRPDFSIVNPELTFSLPPEQIAAGASDILSHIFERYFTRTSDVGLTDRLCEAAIASVIETAPVTLAHPGDFGPRANLIWASTIAHNGSLGVGRQEDWSAHALEAEIGGRYDTTHGAGLAALYPAWMQYMLGYHPERAARLARQAFGVLPSDDLLADGREGIRRLAAFYQSLGLPGNLAALGVKRDDIPALAARAKRNPDGTCGFYLPLRDPDILAIYESAFEWTPERLN
jgi:alcohol dehydrogenase